MTRARVLAVDDDPTITRLLRYWLEQAGIACDLAYSAEQAMQLMRQNMYFVVVADVHMPGMGGVELISAVKEISPLAQVIVLTADTCQRVVMTCAHRGAADFFEKSDNYAELVETVKVVIRRHERWSAWLDAKEAATAPTGRAV